VPLPHHPLFAARWKLVKELLGQKIDGLESLMSVFAQLHRRIKRAEEIEHICVGARQFFRALSSQELQRFASHTLPTIQRLVLEMETAFAGVTSLPLLLSGSTKALHLSRHQVACLLASAFFSLHAQNRSAEARFQIANFDSLFACFHLRPSSQAGKLRCLLHYFDRVGESMPSGVVTFYRRALDIDQQDFSFDIKTHHEVLGDFDVRPNGTIEDHGDNTLQVDFANRYLGGGVLKTGCVQEEIRFVINPECLVGLLFSEVMSDNESLTIIGSERFSHYSGYSRGFEFGGKFEDQTPQEKEPASHVKILGGGSKEDDGKEDNRRIGTVIVAIDALYLRHSHHQFTPHNLLREVYKAYTGFSLDEDVLPVSAFGGEKRAFSTISTGNWGCGAFNGDVGFKSMIQWIAATMSGRSIRYFTFNDPKCDRLQETVAALKHHQVTVHELWSSLVRYCDRIQTLQSARAYDELKRMPSVFQFLLSRYAMPTASAIAAPSSFSSFASSSASSSPIAASRSVEFEEENSQAEKERMLEDDEFEAGIEVDEDGETGAEGGPRSEDVEAEVDMANELNAATRQPTISKYFQLKRA